MVGRVEGDSVGICIGRVFAQGILPNGGEFGEPWDCGEGVEVAAVLLTIDSIPTYLPIYIPGSAETRIHN